jgi:hypothetical protein
LKTKKKGLQAILSLEKPIEKALDPYTDVVKDETLKR